jgi:hypothetical protein
MEKMPILPESQRYPPGIFVLPINLCTAPIIYGDIYWKDNPLIPVT